MFECVCFGSFWMLDFLISLIVVGCCDIRHVTIVTGLPVVVVAALVDDKQKIVSDK